MSDEVLMKIGEIAAFFNVSAKAIRLYEKKGIIKPAKIDKENGYRYYTANQVQQLNALLELKALGFSLDEIQNIMDGAITAEKLINALERKQLAWEETIQTAENKIGAITDISKRLASSKEATQMTTMTPEQRAWLLVKMVCVEDIRAQHTLSEAIWL